MVERQNKGSAVTMFYTGTELVFCVPRFVRSAQDRQAWKILNIGDDFLVKTSEGSK
jgi:hypothetical protein